jgi:hypothetical protein
MKPKKHRSHSFRVRLKKKSPGRRRRFICIPFQFAERHFRILSRQRQGAPGARSPVPVRLSQAHAGGGGRWWLAAHFSLAHTHTRATGQARKAKAKPGHAGPQRGARVRVRDTGPGSPRLFLSGRARASATRTGCRRPHAWPSCAMRMCSQRALRT